MRRALVLASTETPIVNMWSANDSSTRALMRDYYAELGRGAERTEALRQAKLRMPRQQRYAHPFYWAAFISVGDWRSLDQSAFARQEPKP